MAQPIQGIYVPHIVPYEPSGRINEDELRRIIRWLGGKGITGYYPNGSMGEFIRLSYEERKRVLKIVVEESGGKPVLAGAAEPNVDLVLEMCRYAADLGCRAVSITGPYYFKLSQSSIETYFREIAAKSPIDIIIYNIPNFANEISVPVLKRLALDCPRIVGSKDTSRDMCRFQQVIHEIKGQRPDFSCLIGWEELLCTTMFMGADGGTLSTAGVAPELIMRLYDLTKANRWDEARKAQFDLLELFSLMVNAPNFPEGFRAGYELRGFKVGGARFPLAADEAVCMKSIREKLACVLGRAGFGEAAKECSLAAAPGSAGVSQADIDVIVRNVLSKLKA